MYVKIRLFANLRSGRDTEIIINIKKGTGCRNFLEKLNIKPTEVAILLVNDNTSSLDTKLKDGDVVSILPPFLGG